MNERNLWDSVKHPAGLVDMVHVGWVQRLLRSAEWMGFPGPEPDLVVGGQTRVEAHARRIFDKFVELGIEYVAEPTDSEPGAQRVRPVNEVLAFRKATCIDLCVAFCCAALDAGIYPLILTVTADRGFDRHAIVLVPLERMWTTGCDAILETGFSRELLEVDGEALGTMVYESKGDSSGTWLAIDVQQVTEAGANWGAALSSGARYIRDWEWDVCVDVGGLRSRTPDRELPPGGRIEKVLAPAYAALPENFTPLQLIKARHGVVPYQQCAEMRRLRAWATTTADASAPSQGGRSGDIAVAVVTGAGGSGKTRMAAQLCHDLSTIGWYAGFLPSTTEVTDEELAALAAVTTELLVVVDYAEEARRGLIARVVRALRARESATRIVLTARGAKTWWEEFYEEAEQDGTVLRNTLPLSIRGKQEVEADPRFFGRMYRRAVQRFSYDLNGVVLTDVEVPEGLGDTALDVVLRAWLAVCGDNDGAQEAIPTREELYDKVLSIEFARWHKEPKLGDISRKQMRQAAATLSLLAPSQDEDTVDDVLSRLPEWSQEHLLRSRFAELLVQSLLRDDGAEAVSLRPDPVAEYLILMVFGKNPDLLDRVLPQDPAKVPGLDDPDAEDSVVTRALEWGQQVRNACVTLTRASFLDREVALRLARRALRERPFLWKEALDVALTQGGPLGPALEALIESGADLPLGEIDDAIPVGHPALAGAALAATRRLAASAEHSTARQAHWANSLAVRLSDVGERGEALVAAREAVELYRGLAGASPAAYTPDLAASLNNLANRLSAVGERNEALVAAREAVRLRRALAEASPQAYTPDLAMSLNNLAAFLSAVGERNEALVAARKAVELYRGLAEASPAAYTPDLAMSLNNLAVFLSAVGERNEALVAAREAVRLRRALAEASPQAYAPDLATSLNNLADILSADGRSEEAQAVFVEGIDRFSPAVRARLLVARATWRDDGGKAGDVVAAAREADSTDDPALLGPVRRMIARVITDVGISDTGLPRWATVDAESATSGIEGWLECSDLARRVAFLEAQWSLPSASEREALAALAELYVDRPSVAALAALVERIADEGIQAVTTDLRIHHRAQLLARDWREAHVNGRGASFLREHMRGNPDASRGEDQISEGDKQESGEWEKDLGDPDMRTQVLQVLAARLPEAEAASMESVLTLAELADPGTAYDAHGSDEGAEDVLRELLEARNWRAMVTVLGVHPSVAESTYGRIARLLFAAVTDEPVERLRELYEHANEEMDAIHRRQLQALLDKALGTDQCPPAFEDILSWTRNSGPRQQ